MSTLPKISSGKPLQPRYGHGPRLLDRAEGPRHGPAQQRPHQGRLNMSWRPREQRARLSGDGGGQEAVTPARACSSLIVCRARALR